MDKKEFRNLAKQKRDQFKVNSAISQKLKSNLTSVVGSHPGLWGAYLPRGSEADPQLNIKSIQWVYPKICGEVLEFHTPGDNWETNQYGIQEPGSGSQSVDLSQLKGLLIPGICFDRKGHRIGSGKGFYDKTLAQFLGLKVGVGYSVQIFTEIPTESHDLIMDFIVTESEIIQVSERKAS